MSKILQFRDEIIKALKSIPDVRSVEWHDEKIGSDDVGEDLFDVPAIHIAFNDNVQSAPLPTGETSLTIPVSAYVITEDTRGPRDAEAILWSIMEGVISIVSQSRFSLPTTGPATITHVGRVKDENLRKDLAVGKSLPD